MHCCHPLSIAALDCLERIQGKAARICLRLPLYTPLNHSTLLHRLKWPTMFSRRKVKLTLLAHSIKYQYAPQHIFFYFFYRKVHYIPEYVREVVAGPGCSADLKGLGVYADKARHNAVNHEEGRNRGNE